MTGLANIDITLVDDHAFGFGTFQSHNQKVVSNRNGIFMTHIRARNEEYTAQQWRLSHSADGGQSFTTLYEATDATNPPVLETDERDNLYVIRPDFVDRNAYLYRFLAAEGYAQPHISCIPNGSAGKYCARYDPRRQQLYYFAHNNTFHVVGLDGTVRRSYRLLQAGPDAVLQYPHLSLDQDGTLYAAWTTSCPDRYLYWSIHTMVSRDAGETWQKMDGAPLTPPIVADNHGPTDRISRDDEFEFSTWLASCMARDGKLHFIYQYQPPGGSRQHYVRYDLERARKDRDICPDFRGDRLAPSHNDGFFASRAAVPGAPLYCVLAQQGRLVCLVSRDNGETWHDHAVSERCFPISDEFSNPYALGGCRELTADGHILGSFTDRIPDPTHVQRLVAPGSVAPVYFFKIGTGACDSSL